MNNLFVRANDALTQEYKGNYDTSHGKLDVMDFVSNAWSALGLRFPKEDHG